MAIIINCASVYFTSKVYQTLFVGQVLDHEGKGPGETYTLIENKEAVTGGWDLLKFLLFVVLVEHVLLFLKLVVENAIDDVPAEVQAGERERQ